MVIAQMNISELTDWMIGNTSRLQLEQTKKEIWRQRDECQK
jgi:hypothetical protein